VGPITFTKGRVRFTSSFTAPEKALKALSHGLMVDFVVRVYLVEDATGTVVGANATACHVHYDLWQELFRIVSFHGVSYHVNIKGLGRTCLDLYELPLAKLDRLKPQTEYRVIAIAETNPTHPSVAQLLAAHNSNTPLSPLLGTTSQVTGGVPCGGADHRFVAP
jgi:hypothetical protein